MIFQNNATLLVRSNSFCKKKKRKTKKKISDRYRHRQRKKPRMQVCLCCRLKCRFYVVHHIVNVCLNDDVLGLKKVLTKCRIENNALLRFLGKEKNNYL